MLKATEIMENMRIVDFLTGYISLSKTGLIYIDLQTFKPVRDNSKQFPECENVSSINCISIRVSHFLSQMIFVGWKHRRNRFWPRTHVTYASIVRGQGNQRFYEIHLQEISRV